MSTLRAIAGSWITSQQRAVVIEVVEARGSVPRGIGTRMLVGRAEVAGTIGGGHLELKAIARARAMLEAHEFVAHDERFPLGPALGQCCGGVVTLRYLPLAAAYLARWPIDPPRFHLQLYGAGHVGRAIARALAPLNVTVEWIDERDAEYPQEIPANVRKVCVDAVEGEVCSAPAAAFYLVLTHQHDLDLRIAEAILRRNDFGFFGLIGSATKRQRFIHRFEQCGIAPSAITRMTCPIGLPGLSGKEPEVIAASVIGQLLLASSP